MDVTIKIAELISTDIRSRANADLIRSAITNTDGKITLDFTGVTFVSRSFTDELYNVMDENKNITLSGASEFVQSMLNAVIQGRKHKRVFKDDKSDIVEFDDMGSLSSFLSTI